MPVIALPLAGEAALWGTGALGSGLAALGIINNRDAIRDGISDFGDWLGEGIGKILSPGMSRGVSAPSPHYDSTGKPIAVADATIVPTPLLRPQILPRPFGAARTPRQDANGEPIRFAWLVGSPEIPIPLQPVTVIGSRVMRTDEGDSTPAAEDGSNAGSASAAGSSTSAGAASPAPEQGSNNSGNSNNLRKPSFRERLGNWIAGRGNGLTSGGNTPPNNNQNGPFLGRLLWETKNNNFGQNWWQWRNVGRVGLLSSYPAREYLWPAVGTGLKYMAVGPDSIPTQAVPVQPATAPTDTVPAVSNLLLPDSTVVNANSDWEEWRKSRGTE